MSASVFERKRSPDARKAQARAGLNPFIVLFAVVAAINLFSVPIGFGLDYQEFRRALFGITDDEVLSAYAWTVYACAAMVLLYFAFGIHRDVKAYQRRPMVPYSESRYSGLWFLTLVIGLFLVGAIWVQAGLTIPVIAALGADYWSYHRLRQSYGEAINQMLYNVTLYWVATSNLLIAWLHLNRAHVAYRAISTGLFLLVGSFTLARSPLALAFMIVVNYHLFWRPVPWKVLTSAAAAMAVVMFALHFLAGTPGGYTSLGHYLGVRVVYGQWTSLPYYFSIFAHDPAPFSSVLPPILQGSDTQLVSGPSRIVITHMVPEAVRAGVAGVASAFFIGEAYAVGGVPGVIVAPALVMAQAWVIVRSFLSLEKTTLHVFLFSWFLFKLFTGVVSGFSAFLFSSLQAMVLLLFYWVLLSRVLAEPRRAHGAHIPPATLPRQRLFQRRQ